MARRLVVPSTETLCLDPRRFTRSDWSCSLCYRVRDIVRVFTSFVQGGTFA